MLRFFRLLRRKLLEEGHIRKYIWYALGEILLVMIGILLALQVNNWNEKRIKSIEQAIILSNLHDEFDQNLNHLKNSYNNIERLSNALDKLLQIMHYQPDTLSNDEFEELLAQTFGIPSWSTSSVVMEELKNSGGFTKLQENELEKLLFDWESLYAAVILTEQEFNRYGDQYIDYLSENGSVRNLDSISGFIPSLSKSTIAANNLSMLKDPLFENRVDNFYFLAIRVKTIYREATILMEEIIRVTGQ